MNSFFLRRFGNQRQNAIAETSKLFNLKIKPNNFYLLNEIILRFILTSIFTNLNQNLFKLFEDFDVNVNQMSL